MKKMKIWFVLIVLIALGILTKFAVEFAINWRNPGPNYAAQRTDYYIYTDKKQQHVTITSMKHIFDVAYVKNAQPDCNGPYFPAIHIKAKSLHNAWLHVVQTDCTAEPRWLHFIDAWPKGHEHYPFYAIGKDFADNPQWNYSLFSKPLSFWIGHAYAVQIDHEKKTIECVGGISWGFRLPWWSLRPVMILPTALTEKDWHTDWKVFQQSLPEYKNI
ncbi:MAG: hypothetical protein NTZ68_03880 [Candidatus Dependentiae bacterium]|nr:hypothetical protein [Candidatus Dependentiae bacterium]